VVKTMIGPARPSFRIVLVGFAFAASIAVSGCAPSRAGDVYQHGQAQRAQTVELGVLEALRPVRLEGTQTGIGAVSGAAIGGVAGSTVGHGAGSVAAAIGGALLGGLAGNAIEKEATKANGIELTVRLDSGRTIAVVQEGSGAEFRPGDRVRVLSDGYATRVTR
jgi:outer membrane lipoprotein SlyB